MDPRALHRFRKNRGALIGPGMVAFLVVFALRAPFVFGQDPLTSDFVNGRSPLAMPMPPSSLHLFGTDGLYRDELARLAHGARLSLEIGFAASAISLLIGALVGIVAGYSEGKAWALGPVRVSLDDRRIRFVDIGLEFP